MSSLLLPLILFYLESIYLLVALRSNTLVSAGILPSLPADIAPLLPTNFSEPPYSSSFIFSAAEQFLSDEPSVSDTDHPSVVQTGSHINSLHTSQRSDESIRHTHQSSVFGT